MNKKLLGLVLSITFLAMLVTPAMAGKGQKRQSFEFSFKEYPLSTDGPDSHAGPKGSMLGLDLRTFHGRDCTHDSPILEYVINIADIPTSYTITGREGGCNYEFNSKTMIVIHKSTETLTLSNSETDQGTIILSIKEKIDWASPTFDTEGTFIGFGTGIFEDVKITGTTTTHLIDDVTWGYCLEATLTGIVMGWP
jgi:hypothetical protein